jgi:Adaptin N terminal region
MQWSCLQYLLVSTNPFQFRFDLRNCRPSCPDDLTCERCSREKHSHGGTSSKNSTHSIPGPPKRHPPYPVSTASWLVNGAGETFELRNGLVSQYAYERKEAIQKTIAAMTLGKDVSALFPDVLKNIATHDLGQKKLVYLYLMSRPLLAFLTDRNYAKTHPELCILAVNTFVQVTTHPHVVLDRGSSVDTVVRTLKTQIR